MKVPSSQIAYAAYVNSELTPHLDPDAEFWKHTVPITFQHNAYGESAPGHETEVRIAWTDDALHLLFCCHYVQLHLIEGAPACHLPTQELWKHDVAEIFIAAGTDTPTHYAEFEVSPRGEWIALEIETRIPGQPLDSPLPGSAHFAASIDSARRVWFGRMEIPFASLDCQHPEEGQLFRMNLYRSQGTPPVEMAWQPTMHRSFHVPSAFGQLILSR